MLLHRSFVLRKLLALHGLQLGTDFTFQVSGFQALSHPGNTPHTAGLLQVVGGTPIRFSQLTQGTLADGTPTFATILTFPFSKCSVSHEMD